MSRPRPKKKSTPQSSSESEHTQTSDDLLVAGMDAISSLNINCSIHGVPGIPALNMHDRLQKSMEADMKEIDAIHRTIKRLHQKRYFSELSKYDLGEFNGGICAIGIDNFLSAAAQFCEDEARDSSKTTIVSVGCGDGRIEKHIIRAHRQRFGKSISIKLVDSSPEFKRVVDFRNITDLIEKCPHVAGHCVVLIIWPQPLTCTDNYDIDALRRLQPLAAFAIYETTGVSGSADFRAFLHDNSLANYSRQSQTAPKEPKDYGLSNYEIEELVRQKIPIETTAGLVTIRLVKLTRTGPMRTCDLARKAEEVLHQFVEKQLNEQDVRMARKLNLIGEMPSPDDIGVVLAALGLEHRYLDYDYIVRRAKVDYTTLNPHNTMDHAKIMLNAHLSFTELPDLRAEIEKMVDPSQQKKHDLSKFKDGVVGLGVDNFLSEAVQFCKMEARRGTIEIISVGSGDGATEKSIITAYRQRYGKEIRIKLVDPNPVFRSRVNFKTVEDLIKKRPYVVGHCVLMILWPDRAGINDDYDIEAIRQLQPHAALVVYENTGRSGSHDLREFLHDESLDLPPGSEEFGFQNFLDQSCRAKTQNYGLGNYSIKEIARQKVHLRPISGTFTLRMVKLKRM